MRAPLFLCLKDGKGRMRRPSARVSWGVVEEKGGEGRGVFRVLIETHLCIKKKGK